jgi:hypothetical protein
MRNVTLALGSFVLGAVCMFFLGNHTSTFRQFVAFAQAAATESIDPLGNKYTPVVPAPPRALASGNLFLRQVVYLDGLTSIGDTFSDSTLVYGGGAYHLANAKLTGVVDIKLIGAAANTSTFLAMLGLIGCPAKPQAPQINPNAPIIHRATLDKEIKGDLVSPYSGTE